MKFYKLNKPEPGEEKYIFIITNFNEETGRCYIAPVNSELPYPPQELVSFSDLVEVAYREDKRTDQGEPPET